MSSIVSTLVIYLVNMIGSIFTLRAITYMTDFIYDGAKKKGYKYGIPFHHYIFAPIRIAEIFENKLLKIMLVISYILLAINPLISLISLFTSSIIINIVLIYFSYLIVIFIYLVNVIQVYKLGLLNSSIYPGLIGMLCPSIGYILSIIHIKTFFVLNKETLKGE